MWFFKKKPTLEDEVVDYIVGRIKTEELRQENMHMPPVWADGKGGWNKGEPACSTFMVPISSIRNEVWLKGVWVNITAQHRRRIDHALLKRALHEAKNNESTDSSK